MTEKEIRDVFNVVDNMVNTAPKRYIDIDDFLNRFGDSELTLSSLLKNQNVTEDNGWKKRFEELNNKGILPD